MLTVLMAADGMSRNRILFISGLRSAVIILGVLIINMMIYSRPSRHGRQYHLMKIGNMLTYCHS